MRLRISSLQQAVSVCAFAIVCSACSSGGGGAGGLDGGAVEGGGGGGGGSPPCNEQYPFCMAGGNTLPSAPSVVTATGTMGSESFDVSCDFSSSQDHDINNVTYCRWEEAAELPDQLFIDCRLVEGAFWDDILIGFFGFKSPGTYQSSSVFSEPPPEFDFGLSDYDRPTSESLYTSRVGFVSATLSLSVFDLCQHHAKGSIDATWTEDDGSVLPGEAHVSFDVHF